MAFGGHTLTVTSIDDSSNAGAASIAFNIQPEPMSMAIKTLKVDWRDGHGKAKEDRLKVSGSLELPKGYQPDNLTPEVRVEAEIGGVLGTDTVSMKAKHHDWDYAQKKKKKEAGNGTNLEITKLKLKWEKKDERQASFSLDADLTNMTDDGTGVVTITLLIPVESCGDLAGSQAVTCKLHKHHWDYHSKKDEKCKSVTYLEVIRLSTEEEVSAGNGIKKLKANTTLKFSDGSSVKVHTSCSQEIYLGMEIGDDYEITDLEVNY